MTLTVFPATTEEPCAIHLRHAPVPHTVELHHVIPQAWQRAWAPRASSELWHPETVPLCPSGHRDVHLIIDYVMHQFAAMDPIDRRDDLALAVLTKDTSTGEVRRWSEWQTALQAPMLWMKAGGSLTYLTQAGLWGQA